MQICVARPAWASRMSPSPSESWQRIQVDSVLREVLAEATTGGESATGRLSLAEVRALRLRQQLGLTEGRDPALVITRDRSRGRRHGEATQRIERFPGFLGGVDAVVVHHQVNRSHPL